MQWQIRRPSAADDQFPVPGSAEKYFSNLPSSPLWASASAGASPFDVILGHCAENVVFRSIHCSRPLSVPGQIARSEEHTSELQSLKRISYAVFCLKKKKPNEGTLLKHKPAIRPRANQRHRKTIRTSSVTTHPH